jgi:nucleotide-binding universal stress UspA family protein
MLKVLIAIDGSDHARHAIEVAARLARDVPALDVVLLNVREPFGYQGEFPPYDFEALERGARAQQQRLLDEAMTQARANGLRQVATQSAVGSPAKEIVREAVERDVDEIIMGTRGMNALAGLLVGSVAQRVLHLATVPVVLVK